ncbi:GTPase IMAP family member 8-like isoform X3 [Alosa sapidissima]|uniref:GTPase IMAP family member 8-like isoform X3 n=2 Tax=Alosa sapidissima TaxID=34773 RepID=UPI001C092F26|nr:GTPase IMAP family member 8-like isoform X3 [Alosa sapidissima]
MSADQKSENCGSFFEIDRRILTEMEKKREEERRAKRRAEERKMKVQKQRETLRSAAGGVPHISHMRIVLLGSKELGKSSSGNTILGREEFGVSGRTAECVKREGETSGRHITVVDAPGWWNNYTVEQTSERDKQMIVLSVFLCPPGPHALLLNIDVSMSLRENHRRAVQQHMELLGERVWSHTIVLFTKGDLLGDTTIEQYIESGGEALQWVVEKCGNRYHVVDNKKRDRGQVTELLEKIEEMVAGNRGHQFDFDAEICKALQEKKREEERRAEERKMKVQKQRQTLRSAAGGVPHISDMRILLLGHRDAGKSSSGNTILGREEFGVSGRTAECVKREGETAGRHITIVEAPGWWYNYTVELTPEHHKRGIVLSVFLCPPGPHALLLLINASMSFTEKYRRGVQGHMELLGERVWSHTIVLFTKGDLLGDTTIEQHIESGGEALQWVVEKCGNRYHVVDNKKRDRGQVTELLEKIEEMVAGNRGHQFDFDAEICKALQEKKREEERRAEERKMKVQKQRQTLRSAAGGVPHISHMRIVLLGSKELGKSSSGNTILGREEFGVSGRTAECVKREGETSGRHITVVDAPGWWNNYTVEQTSERDKQMIVLSVFLCPPGPHALLLNIDVSMSLRENHRRAVQQHMELLGERVWSHTIVLFTKGDLLGDTTIEQYIESGGEALQWVVEKCGNRYHVVDNKKRDRGQVTELLEKIEEMVMRNSGEWSMDEPLEFSEVLPDDYSTGDSAHGSTKPTPKPELIKAFKQLSTAASTQSSGFGSAETGERSGSAEESFSLIPPIRGDGGGNTKGATAAQQKTPLRPTHGTTLTAKSRDYPVTNPFVDETTIGVDYTECIGHGSYGKVYRGSYQGTPAAVKIIPTGDNSVTTNEFIIPGRLSHSNIVRILAVAKSETQILIANEYIHGANLQQILFTDTPIELQLEDKLFVALDIAMAVEYIHGRKIIHQDLKPANIMITADNKKAHLTDWGLANVKETVSMTKGSCGPLGGTPPYMAPECLVKCENCSTMSDMWSLGITLLEMFTNSKPWSNSNPQELRKLLLKKNPPQALSKLQPALHDIVKPLIKYKPKSRKNAKDLVILLKSKVDVTKRYGFKW